MPTLTNPTVRDMPAAAFMTTTVIVCEEDATFEEAVDLLADNQISGAPVVDRSGLLTGIISERDLAHALGGPAVRLCLRRSKRRGVMNRPAEEIDDALRVRDLMTVDPLTARPETPLHAIAEILFKENINRVPIVNHRRVVGIVTRGDVMAAIAGLRHHRTNEQASADSFGGTR